MKIPNHNLAPWLALLLCVTLSPALQAAGEADAPKTPPSQATSAQPQLAEQDVWRRWKLAHDGKEAPQIARPPQTRPQTGLAEQDVWRRWKAAQDARETGALTTSN